MHNRNYKGKVLKVELAEKKENLRTKKEKRKKK